MAYLDDLLLYAMLLGAVPDLEEFVVKNPVFMRFYGVFYPLGHTKVTHIIIE